jgi:hypothetical protein
VPHRAAAHTRHLGRAVGNGHCVAYVREVAGLPNTARWRRGNKVRGSDCELGTIIATFDPDGQYGNHGDGRSHCAVLLAERSNGLLVMDQWLGRTVHERTIRFRDGKGDAVNDGDAYFIVELADEDG